MPPGMQPSRNHPADPPDVPPDLQIASTNLPQIASTYTNLPNVTCPTNLASRLQCGPQNAQLTTLKLANTTTLLLSVFFKVFMLLHIFIYLITLNLSLILIIIVYINKKTIFHKNCKYYSVLIGTLTHLSYLLLIIKLIKYFISYIRRTNKKQPKCNIKWPKFLKSSKSLKYFILLIMTTSLMTSVTATETEHDITSYKESTHMMTSRLMNMSSSIDNNMIVIRKILKETPLIDG